MRKSKPWNMVNLRINPWLSINQRGGQSTYGNPRMKDEEETRMADVLEKEIVMGGEEALLIF
eukprot:scaffold67484_cov22-Cyclotella_meneghiniana.AAC.1